MKYIYFIMAVLLANTVTAQNITYRTVKENLFIPWEIIYGPDDHIWFTQKNGYICRMDPNNGDTDTLYHETSTVIKSEGGLTGLALHHDFVNQPYVFAAYNYDDNGSYKVRVSRYEYANNALSNATVLIADIAGANFHNGCRLLELNGKLFITTGDATNTSTSQNINSVNGKTLRINIDGTIPTDNPIAGSPLWSWGHRNAQGMIYANGKLYQSEHGDNSNDEVNLIEKGRNYGWPNVKGFCDLAGEQNFCNDSNVAEPLYAWTPTIAVCGIDYYDKPMFSQWDNSILMATLKDQTLYQLQLDAGGDNVTSVSKVFTGSYGRLRDVCVSPLGKVYVSTSNSSASGTGSFVDKIVELSDPSFNLVRVFGNDPLFKVYPNPATGGTIVIRSEKPVSCKYVISSVDGRKVFEGFINSEKTTIETDVWAKGIYVLDVYSNSKTKIYTEKISVQ